MVYDVPAQDVLAHRQAQEILRRNALHRQRRVVPEAKAVVKSRIADQDATLSAQVANGLQPRLDQAGADSLSLPWGHHCDGPEGKPRTILAADLDRGKGNVPHHTSVNFRHQPDCQIARGSQGIDNQVLSLMTVGMVGKGGDQDASDSVVVVGRLRANNYPTT